MTKNSTEHIYIDFALEIFQIAQTQAPQEQFRLDTKYCNQGFKQK